MTVRIPRAEVAQAGGVVRRTVNAAGGQATARGADGFAEGIAQVGRAALQFSNNIKEDRGRQALTEADLQYRRRAADTISAFDNDQDIDTLADRGVASLTKIREDVALQTKHLRGKFASAFMESSNRDIEQRRLELLSLQRRKQIDDLNAADLQFVDTQVRPLLENPTARPEDRDLALEGYRLRLQAGLEFGRYTKTQAEQAIQDLEQRRQQADAQFQLQRAQNILQQDPQAFREGVESGQFKHLAPAQIENLLGVADRQDEILAQRREADRERAAAKAAVEMRKSVSEQLQRVQAGLPLTQQFDDAEIRSVLGDEVADTLIAGQEESHVRQTLQLASSTKIAELAARQAPSPEAPLKAHRLYAATQNAIARVVKDRQDDPIAYAQSVGLIDRQDDVARSLASGQVDEVFFRGLPARRAAAEEAENRLGFRAGLLNKQEVAVLADVYEQLPTSQRVALLGSLHRAAGKNYREIVQAIRPDSPSTQIAGALVSSAYNVKGVSGPQAAELILLGEDALRPSKASSGQDGKPKYQIPSDADLRAEFDAYVGSSYANYPKAQEAAYQAYRAIYAGIGFLKGDISKDLDTRRAKEAVELATGGVVKWGGKPLLLPWGMDGTNFVSGVQKYWPDLIRQRGGNLTGTRPKDWDLEPVRDGYYRVRGAVDKDGKPVTIRVGPQSENTGKPQPARSTPAASPSEAGAVRPIRGTEE